VTWTASASESDVFTSAGTVCGPRSRRRSQRAERDVRGGGRGRGVPCQTLSLGGIVDEDGGGTREGGDEPERFEALPETRGELGEQALLWAGHGGDEGS
jgi:hypothetical protein